MKVRLVDLFLSYPLQAEVSVGTNTRKARILKKVELAYSLRFTSNRKQLYWQAIPLHFGHSENVPPDTS